MTTHHTDEKKPARGGLEAGLMIHPRMEAMQLVSIDGYLVPRLEVHEDAASGQWNVIYDGRFAVTASIEELNRWIWLIAQAQAVGGGYSCHGENSVDRPNPYKIQMLCIGSVLKGTQEG
ncbi:hypothetical protein [Comamonas aquatica]|jgi:hypothetical protein|uniref:hypothetical protein n=1 Tax=Comamonas aquatica TaxID=225991 RepID=UPI0028D3740A|nr:hypothetical protein [Comamonas aquatica]